MQFAKFSVVFDQISARYGASPGVAGIMLSVVGVIGLIFGVSGGIVVSYAGFRRTMIGALMIGAACSSLQAFLPPLPVMMATRLIEGFSHLGIVVAAPTLMGAISAERHRSIVMGLWGTFFGVAFAAMASLAVPLTNYFGLGGLFAFHATLLMALTAIIATLSTLESRILRVGMADCHLSPILRRTSLASTQRETPSCRG
jgi:MFS family permease